MPAAWTQEQQCAFAPPRHQAEPLPQKTPEQPPIASPPTPPTVSPSPSNKMASATFSTLQTPSYPVPNVSTTSASTSFAPINIGTRSSTLAQVQARAVEKSLKEAFPDRTYNIVPVLAQGDKDKVTPLQQLSQGENAKSLWTGELEAMLESGEVDLIVHCLKGIETSCKMELVDS